MNKSITIVKDFMSKYNITKKDLFSFCICAVNFLEHMEEECTGDVMMNCPDKYYYVNSNNTRAVAGALSGEKKAKGWTDEEQFSYYMMCVQRILTDKIDERDLHYFLKEYKVFEKVYKRSIMIPFMLGCPVEEYDDSRFSDKKYIRSITKADNLTIYKASLEDMEAERQVLRDKAAVNLAKEEGRHAGVFHRYTKETLKPGRAKSYLIAVLYYVLGRNRLYKVIAKGEYDAAVAYEHLISEFPEVQSVKGDEKRHGDIVSALIQK